MLVTILLLIFTVVVLPIVSFYFGTPLSDIQHSILVDHMVYVVGAVVAYCFLVGELTRNNSQVDKLWSIIRIPYVWIIAYNTDFEPRILLMAFLVSIWAVRLTYNFARRGGYSWKIWTGEEDYRWAILRAKPEFQSQWKWSAFNLFFISAYQMALILFFTLPALKAMESNIPIGIFVLYLGLSHSFLI